MPLPQGWSFRQTSGYVSDTSPDEFPGTSGNPPSGSDYPTTYASGVTAGWENLGGVFAVDSRNRSTTNPRLAGMHFPDGADQQWRVDLPATGNYKIQAAFGDATYSTNVNVDFIDSASVLANIGGGSSTGAGNSFYDANNSVRTAAAWIADTNNRGAVRDLTFASTIFRVFCRNGAGSMAHLYIESAAVPALTQSRYRWRNDDGSETGATWAAAENTAITLAQNTPRRLRVQVQSTNDKPSASYKLQYRKVGDPGWDDVT